MRHIFVDERAMMAQKYNFKKLRHGFVDETAMITIKLIFSCL